MKCPKCNGKVQVVETIQMPENQVARRRKCLECGRRFYTSEQIVKADLEILDEMAKYHRTRMAYFKEAMSNIRQKYGDDAEGCHKAMDILMCETLTKLGYGEGVEIFMNSKKWYA